MCDKTPLPPGWLAWLVRVSVGCAVVVLFGVLPLHGGDLWMHLTVGRWIWQHRAVPWVDDFSYLSAGAPFVAHSWGAEVLFYLIEQSAGVIGLTLLRMALISAALGFALCTARLLGVGAQEHQA
jgi:hypothetical protein